MLVDVELCDRETWPACAYCRVLMLEIVVTVCNPDILSGQGNGVETMSASPRETRAADHQKRGDGINNLGRALMMSHDAVDNSKPYTDIYSSNNMATTAEASSSTGGLQPEKVEALTAYRKVCWAHRSGS